MKRWKIAALTFVVTAVLCVAASFLLGWTENLVDSQTLTLWYIQGDCSQQKLERLKSQYNFPVLSKRQKLSLRAFESEEELAAAFESETPDLLLCSSVKAEDLYARGLLSDCGSDLGDCPVTLEAKGCFLPLGSRLTVLMLNEAKCAAAGIQTDFDSLEALAESCKAYTKATGEAFFSASSYAELMDAELCALGAPFSGNMKEDAKDRSFTYVYNILAECGYEGALLALGPQSAAKVAEGSLAGACVRCDELADFEVKGVVIRALPMPEKGEKKYPAELMGLAVTAKEEGAVWEAAAFLSWLQEEGLRDKLSAASALIPVSPSQSGDEHYWQPLLDSFSDGSELCYEPRQAQREKFDLSFGAALDLLH